jgi:hypothetical protein
VLKILRKEKLVVAGMPWQPPNFTQEIGLDSLTSKCLCTAHNSALSPLDEAASSLFTLIESAFVTEQIPSVLGLVSGHDVERWLLKTLAALSHSKSLMTNRQKISAPLHSTIDIPELLGDPLKWQKGAGLYLTGEVGNRMSTNSALSIAPLTVNESGELVGLLGQILGINFAFLATPPQLFSDVPYRAHWRPSKLIFDNRTARNEIQFCWEDGQPHQDFAFTRSD